MAWLYGTLELIAGIVGSKKWVPRKMLEIVRFRRETDDEEDVKWSAIRRSEFYLIKIKDSELQTAARRAIVRRKGW